MWVWIGAGLALASPELELERGRVAVRLEQYDQARDHALSALRQSPNLGDAHQLYVDATAAAGLGSRGLQELVAYDVQTPPWYATTSALQAALEEDDWKTSRDLTEQLLVTWPDRPDLLVELWGSEHKKIVKLRERLVEAWVEPEALDQAQLEVLYRLYRVLQEADSPHLPAVVQVLVDQGEPEPPARQRFDRIQRSEIALQMSKDQLPALPWGYPSELVDVVERLADIWDLAGRSRHNAMAYQQLQRLTDDPTAWTGEAESWLAAGELDKALRAAEDGVVAATHPRAVDLMSLNDDLQRASLSRALLVRAQIHEARSYPQESLADLALANTLAREHLDDKLGERLDRLSGSLVPLVEAEYRGRDRVAAAVAAADRVAGDDLDAALRHIDAALFLTSSITRGGSRAADQPEIYGGLFAPILMARAELQLAQGRTEAARADAVMATLLAGRSQPWWWATRGEIQEKNGEYDAAFASYAIARGLGVPELDEGLQKTYVGLGSWKAAAIQVGGLPPAEPAPPPGTAAPVAVAAPRTRGKRPSTAPSLGRPFPDFSVATDAGTLSTAALRGRALIITFWSSDCEECLQMLTSFGSVARQLRKESRDTVLIGVSLDEDAADFAGVYRLGQRWGELVHEPSLGPRFGVTRLPTTWIVDRAGVARYYLDHWFSAEELERYVRDVE